MSVDSWRWSLRCAAAGVAAALLGACSELPVEPAAPDLRPQAPSLTLSNAPTVDQLPGNIFICKEVPEGAEAVPASFAVDGYALDENGNPMDEGVGVQVLPGTCEWIFTSLPDPEFIVFEYVPEGWSLAMVVKTDETGTQEIITGGVGAYPPGDGPTFPNAIHCKVDANHGCMIVFHNAPNTPPPPPPPPPPLGGEGCTPGYWKQKHHFGNWTSPYTPSTTFSSVFGGTPFGGHTLLHVLGQGGGGLKALGRHTVAALLNAASAGVEYDLTTDEVIQMFQDAYASGDYEAMKNVFESLNEQGCGLGRAE